jgi:hypothetical protein
MKGMQEGWNEGTKEGGNWLYLYYGTIPAFTSRDEETHVRSFVSQSVESQSKPGTSN